MKRKALGKGLSALLPDPEPAPAHRDGVGEVSVDDLEPNPFQPRGSSSAAALEELTTSIRQAGVVQPILVRRLGSRYQIIAGERRWRAARRAGLQTVPIHIREVPDDQLLELALVENIQREELSALEEAQAYQRLQTEFRLTQEDVALRVGKDRSTVANAVRLLRLPRAVRELLAEKRLGAGHARALLAIEEPQAQVTLAREAVRRGWSVREVERRAGQRRPAAKPASQPEPNTRAAEERLRAALGTRVTILRQGQGGQIRLAFKSEAELNRLFESLLRAAGSRAGGHPPGERL